jgi:tRNA (guanosine-2'-O-)-methyltransferase
VRTERRLQKIRSVLEHRRDDLTVVLEDVHDAHNASAILRSADAVGVKEIQLLYTKEKFPSLGRKSSASAAKWVMRRKFRSIRECFSKLHHEGFVIYASRLTPAAISVFDLDLTKKVALVFGNEHRGVSEEAASQADGQFKVPMYGMTESLNVSVACAVSLYEALRQRLANGHFSMAGLDEEGIQELLEEWVKK